MRAFTVPKGAPSFSEIWVCGKPGEEGEFDRFALAIAQFRHGRAHPLAVVASREHVIRALRRSWSRVLVRLTGRGLDKTGSSLPGAQAIDRLMSRNHHRPSKEAAPCRIVGSRSVSTSERKLPGGRPRIPSDHAGWHGSSRKGRAQTGHRKSAKACSSPACICRTSSASASLGTRVPGRAAGPGTVDPDEKLEGRISKPKRT